MMANNTHYSSALYVNPFSAGTIFRRQMTCKDGPRTERIKILMAVDL